jgi:DNA-binding LacI/PurR family transcriptional regulator
MNIYEIAKKADVSIATVSRAVNTAQRHKVAKDTLKRIDLLIQEVGYTPNLAAKNLGCSQFKTIGLVLPHFSGIFYTDYYVHTLAGLAEGLLDSDYRFKLIMLKSDQIQWDSHNKVSIPKSKSYDWDKYQFKAGEGVDGLIINQWPLFFSSVSAIEQLGIPCWGIGDPVPSAQVHFSSGDNVKGGWLAAEFFYKKGHRRFAVVTGPSWSIDSHLRVKGFRDFFKSIKAKVSIACVDGHFHEENSALVTERLLKKDNKITAFFCCTDTMAFGVVGKLKELGIDCPRDISVMGYDDDTRSQFLNLSIGPAPVALFPTVKDAVRSQFLAPGLTTIRVPVFDMVKDAAKRLVERLEKPNQQPSYGQTLFPVSLVERSSVKSLS